MSQKILQYIEIDVDYCSLTYSVPPCQARLDTDGDAVSNNTLLLLRGDTNSPAGIVDSSPFLRAVTPNGGVTGTTSQFVFGGASMSFDGGGDFLTVADSPDWDFGTSDFTIDWWERRTFNNVTRTAIARDATTTFAPFLIGYDSGSGGVLQVYMTSDGANWDIANAKALGTSVLDTWFHRAIVRNGTTFRTFQNGVFVDGWTSSAALFPNANPLSIGRSQGTGDFAGFMDDVRITNRALWTNNFIPPQRALATFTGTKKCFNTLSTCQDRANFSNAPVTLRFAVPTADLRSDVE